jgi:hypothetical protein
LIFTRVKQVLKAQLYAVRLTGNTMNMSSLLIGLKKLLSLPLYVVGIWRICFQRRRFPDLMAGAAF